MADLKAEISTAKNSSTPSDGSSACTQPSLPNTHAAAAAAATAAQRAPDIHRSFEELFVAVTREKEKKNLHLT